MDSGPPLRDDDIGGGGQPWRPNVPWQLQERGWARYVVWVGARWGRI
jgi:hypothetical protein